MRQKERPLVSLTGVAEMVCQRGRPGQESVVFPGIGTGVVDQQGNPVRPPLVRYYPNVVTGRAKYNYVTSLPLSQVLLIPWFELGSMAVGVFFEKRFLVRHPPEINIGLGVTVHPRRRQRKPGFSLNGGVFDYFSWATSRRSGSLP